MIRGVPSLISNSKALLSIIVTMQQLLLYVVKGKECSI